MAKDIVYTHHEWWTAKAIPRPEGDGDPGRGEAGGDCRRVRRDDGRRLYREPVVREEAVRLIVAAGAPLRSGRRGCIRACRPDWAASRSNRHAGEPVHLAAALRQASNGWHSSGGESIVTPLARARSPEARPPEPLSIFIGSAMSSTPRTEVVEVGEILEAGDVLAPTSSDEGSTADRAGLSALAAEGFAVLPSASRPLAGFESLLHSQPSTSPQATDSETLVGFEWFESQTVSAKAESPLRLVLKSVTPTITDTRRRVLIVRGIRAPWARSPRGTGTPRRVRNPDR